MTPRKRRALALVAGLGLLAAAAALVLNALCLLYTSDAADE